MGKFWCRIKPHLWWKVICPVTGFTYVQLLHKNRRTGEDTPQTWSCRAYDKEGNLWGDQRGYITTMHDLVKNCIPISREEFSLRIL